MKHYIKILMCMTISAALLCSCTHSPEKRDGILPNQSVTESGSAGSTSSEKPVVLPDSLSLPYYTGQSLDPITSPEGVQQTVSALLCEGLFELDASFAPQPRICSTFTYDPATLTYVFTLRPGTLFSDGSPLTSSDVVSTLKRAQTSARYGARLRGVASIAAGSGTVTITLSAPNTALPSLLDIPIVKSASSETAPIGTGPYRMIASEDGTVLTANPNWQGGKQPVEQILLKPVESADTVLYQFASHETQLLTSDLTGSRPVSVTGNVRFYDANSTIFQYIGINISRSPLQNAAVRQALNLGIDREQTVSAFLSGHGKATQFPVFPEAAQYPVKMEKTYSYDAFQKAMTAAGCNTGSSVSLTMIVNEESSFKVAAARNLASLLSAFDLKIHVSVLPWKEYTAALASGDFDLYYGELKLSADWDLRPLLATGGAVNYGGYSDPVLDTMLNTTMASGDRTAAMKNVCHRIQTESPILPVCFKTVSVLVQDGVVENLTPTAANPFYDLANCKVHLKTAD